MVNENKGPVTENEILDLLPGYVMGILEPDELLMVDEYIQLFPHIELRVATLEESVGALAFTAPAAAPPIDAKVHILTRASQGIQSQVSEASATVSSDDAAAIATPILAQPAMPATIPAATPTLAPSRTNQPFQPRAQRQARPPAQFELYEESTSWWQRALGWKIATLGAAAAAVAMLALMVQNQASIQNLQSELATVQQDLASVQSTNDTLLSANETLETERTAQQETIAEQQDVLLAQQEAFAAQQVAQQVQTTSMLTAQRAVFLNGTDDAPLADASLLVGDNNQGTLLLSGLDPLPEDQTYQLWLIPDDGTPVPAGLFAVADSESTLVTLDLPIVEQGFTTVGISIEPAAGSPAPTGPIVLLGT